VLLRSMDPQAILKLSQNYTGLTALGKQHLQDKEVYVIAAKTAEGSTEKFFFDAASFLQVGFQFEEETPNGSMETLTLFSQFKSVGGILLPFLIHQKGEDEFNITLESVQVNSPIDDTLFAKPTTQP
jgi:hypothetical protein